LGEVALRDIPPATAGNPQIEVIFQIDSNGVLTVGAKDRDTEKFNITTVSSDNTLTEESIESMIKDAEMHAEEDGGVRAMMGEIIGVGTEGVVGLSLFEAGAHPSSSPDAPDMGRLSKMMFESISEEL